MFYEMNDSNYLCEPIMAHKWANCPGLESKETGGELAPGSPQQRFIGET